MKALTDGTGETVRDVSRREKGETASAGSGIAGMEIADYIKIIRKRIWVVVLIPVLGVVAAAAILLSRPTQYSATATVAAPWLISNAPGDAYATANGARQFVADFVAAISVPPVVDAAAEATGASQESIRGNVTTTPIGESTLIQVRYVTADQREAEPVARALAIETLRFLFRPSTVASGAELGEEPPGSFLAIQRLELLLAQPETVTVSTVQVEPRAPGLIRGAQVAIGGGLLLGLLVVILLEIFPFDRLRPWAARHLARRSSRGTGPAAAPPRPVPQDAVATSEAHVVDADQRTERLHPADAPRGSQSDDRRLVERPADQVEIEPVPTGGRAADTGDKKADPSTRKPRATKTRQGNRSKPAKRQPAAAKPEPIPKDAVARSDTDVVGADLPAEAPHPAATDGDARNEQKPKRNELKPKRTQRRRPSRADARRGSASDDGPVELPSDGPRIEPVATDGRSADPEAGSAHRAAKKPPATGTEDDRNLPGGEERAEARPEPVPEDVGATSETEVVDVDPRTEARHPAATDGDARDEQKPKTTRTRRPSRADARRGSQSDDGHPVDRSPVEPNAEPADEDGSATAHRDTDSATRAMEEQRTAAP